MTIRPWALVLIAVISFAFGRYSAPERVKIEHEVVKTDSSQKEETKNVSTDAQRDKHVERVVTEVVRPDGTKETTTRTVEDSSTAKRRESSDTNREASQSSSDEKSSKEIVYGRNKLNISALAGSTLSFSSGASLGPIVYGAHVQRSLLGPITFGVWGLSTGTGGISLGLSF